MEFNKDKKKKLVERLAKRRAAATGVGTSSPTTPPPSATSAPNTTKPAPVHNRQKRVVAVVVDLEDGDICTGLVFKRLRVGEAVAPSHSTSGGFTPTFRDNPLSASSPRHLIVHEGGGRVPLEARKCLPLPNSLPFSKKTSNVFKTKRLWRAWRATFSKTAWLGVLETSLSHPTSL